MAYPRLEFFLQVKEAHHLRELFNNSIEHMHEKRVQRLFLRRIRKLLRAVDPFDKFYTREALLNLREDIEDEIETGRLSKSSKFNPHTNRKQTEEQRAEVLAIVQENSEAALEPLQEESVDEDLPTVKEMEKALILKVLKQSKDNRTMAARALGISIRTLRNKLNAYLKEEAQINIPGGNHGQKNH